MTAAPIGFAVTMTACRSGSVSGNAAAEGDSGVAVGAGDPPSDAMGIPPAMTDAGPSAAADSAPPKLTVPPLHRAAATACAPTTPKADVDWVSVYFPRPLTLECTTNADCTEKPGGRCAAPSSAGRGATKTTCVYDECLMDSDCPGTAICECGAGESEINSCVPSDCRVDADCDPGRYCAAGFELCCASSCHGVHRFHCTSLVDLCVPDVTSSSDRQCPQGEELTSCSFYRGRWQCAWYMGCI